VATLLHHLSADYGGGTYLADKKTKNDVTKNIGPGRIIHLSRSYVFFGLFKIKTIVLGF